MAPLGCIALRTQIHKVDERGNHTRMLATAARYHTRTSCHSIPLQTTYSCILPHTTTHLHTTTYLFTAKHLHTDIHLHNMSEALRSCALDRHRRSSNKTAYQDQRRRQHLFSFGLPFAVPFISEPLAPPYMIFWGPPLMLPILR